MRRLLIKLVAIETALVGWLGYWLFLVYSNNPSVSQGLAAQLSRFPQLSFTTVDISVLVIIGILSLVLAFKFQRGLKPGIRLERALQMLENLMKRNLVLEAQVAELKLEKVHTPIQMAVPAVSSERPGSWERAFRTPLEAGPSVPSVAASSVQGKQSSAIRIESSKERDTLATRAFQPVRVESKIPPQLIPPTGLASSAFDAPVKPTSTSEEASEKPRAPSLRDGDSAIWEDSPKRISETIGVTAASSTVRKQGSFPLNVSKIPYIPAPVRPPSGVIVGPGFSSSPAPKPLGRIPVGRASAKSGPALGTPAVSVSGSPPGPLTVVGPGLAKTAELKASEEAKPREEAKAAGKEAETEAGVVGSKSSEGPVKKKLSSEDEQSQ